MNKNLYQELLDEYQDDPESLIYDRTLELQDAICRLHPDQKLPVRWILCAIEWLSDIAVYLKTKEEE